MSTTNGDIAAKFRAAGLRVTPQRRAVWSAFGTTSDEHLAADEVFGRARRELPELSRATVYNTLAAFVEAGLLQAVDNRGATLYDPNPDQSHHHFRCRVCDRLYDVHVEGVEDMRVSGDEARGAAFIVEKTSVLLGGVCPECSAGQRAHQPNLQEGEPDDRRQKREKSKLQNLSEGGDGTKVFS